MIAAEIDELGTEALPGIESKLRSMDVFSAWQLLPDLQVGIVHVKTDKQLANVLALVSRMASNRVGVSAQFDDLRDTAQALRYARVTLRGRPDEGTAGHAVRRLDTGHRRGQRARGDGEARDAQRSSASPNSLTMSVTFSSRPSGCGWRTTDPCAP